MDGAARSAGGGAAPLSLADLPATALSLIAAHVLRMARLSSGEEHDYEDLGALRACCAATRAAVGALGAGHLRARRARSLARSHA